MRGKTSDPELAARVVAKVAAWQEEHKVSDAELSRRLSASPVLVVPRRRRGRRVKTAPNDTDRIVLRLLSEGLNQTDIARRLGVTPQAVSGRIKRIPREAA